MIVALIGDLKGDRDWAVSRLRELGERGDVQVACQLGDLRFGMGPDHEAYLAAIEAVCAEFDLRLLCINGNHENWDRLDQLWSEPRWQCKDGSWWPSEVITEEHVAATVAGGHAEIMFTHDSPAPPYCTEPVADVMTNNPNGWPDSILAYAEEGIDKITRAVVGVRPLLLAHGHFHVAGEAVIRLPGAPHDTTVWSLGANGDPANVRLLDLEALADANPQGLGREGVVPGELELDG